MRRTPAGLLDEGLRLKGISGSELSRRSGVAESRISDYRSGRHDPAAGRLIELLEAAGLDLSVRANFDRNGLILAELFELSDALSVGTVASRPARLPSFAELTQRHD